MPFGYLIKINKLRPNIQFCVVKKTQNTSFGVVDLHRQSASIRWDRQSASPNAIRKRRLSPSGSALRMVG
jgi:hypothetical protein